MADSATRVSALSTGQIGTALQEIMSMQPAQLSDYHAGLFPFLLQAYLQRPDRKPELAASATAYASRLPPRPPE